MLLVYSGILFLSSATLILELALTRIFSIAQWYHFAFMIISLVFLGFGASGSLLYLFPSLMKRNLYASLAISSLGFALLSLGNYVAVNNIPFDSYRIAWETHQLFYLVVYYFCLSLPFFFAGLVLGIALSELGEHAGKIYGFNLVGSGLGCFLMLGGSYLFNPTKLVAFASLLGLLATLLFLIKYSKRGVGFTLALGALFFPLLFNLPEQLEIRMSPHKSLSQTLLQPKTHIAWIEWNSFSRVDLIESPSLHIAPGLSFAYKGDMPPQTGIAVDGANLSPISKVEAKEAEFTEYSTSALAYYLLPKPQTLIIEPHGDLDLLTALHHNSSSVTGVVSNPLIAQVIKEESYTYDDSRTQVIVEGSRSYLRHTDREFNIIQISLSDSFNAVTAGTYSLSENYLYTVEAFKEYYKNLAPGGILSLTRWIQLPPSEGVRVCSIAVDALKELNVKNPPDQIAAIRSMRTLTLLVKRGLFNLDDISKIKRFCDKRQFDLVYYPGISKEELNRYNVLPDEFYHEAFSKILSSHREDFFENYSYDVSPATDNRPFFFHFFKWDQTLNILQSLGKTFQPFGGFGFLIVIALLAAAIVFSIIFILLPVLLRPKSKSNPTSRASYGVRWRVLIYFSALGTGYFFIEIPLLQRLIGFLDQPIYSFAVVLFTILFFSGLGSLASAKLANLFPYMILSLGVLAILYPLGLSALFEATLGQVLTIRFLIAIISLAPLSFLMGIPFPSGVRILSNIAPDLIPWAWGINGCLSVISSILALVIALSYGFSVVIMGAGGAYLLALAAIYHWRSSALQA